MTSPIIVERDAASWNILLTSPISCQKRFAHVSNLCQYIPSTSAFSRRRRPIVWDIIFVRIFPSVSNITLVRIFSSVLHIIILSVFSLIYYTYITGVYPKCYTILTVYPFVFAFQFHTLLCLTAQNAIMALHAYRYNSSSSIFM